MGRMIYNMLRIRKKDIALICTLQALAGAGSVIILFIVENIVKDNSSIFMLGTAFSLMVMVFVSFFMGCTTFRQTYNLSITMGCTRKEFFISYYITTFIGILIQALMVYIYYWLENLEIKFFYSEIMFEKGPEVILFSPYMLLLIIFISALTMIMGTSVLRFGKKVYIVFWVLWMALCIMPSKVEDAFEVGIDNAPIVIRTCINTIIPVINLPLAAHIVLVLMISAVMFMISALLIRRQQVV